jgi:hypothetical protein
LHDDLAELRRDMQAKIDGEMTEAEARSHACETYARGTMARFIARIDAMLAASRPSTAQCYHEEPGL